MSTTPPHPIASTRVAASHGSIGRARSVEASLISDLHSRPVYTLDVDDPPRRHRLPDTTSTYASGDFVATTLDCRAADSITALAATMVVREMIIRRPSLRFAIAAVAAALLVLWPVAIRPLSRIARAIRIAAPGTSASAARADCRRRRRAPRARRHAPASARTERAIRTTADRVATSAPRGSCAPAARASLRAPWGSSSAAPRASTRPAIPRTAGSAGRRVPRPLTARPARACARTAKARAVLRAPTWQPIRATAGRATRRARAPPRSVKPACA